MQAKKTKAELQDKDLLRYNRNIVLPEIDIDGQLSLLKSKVAVIGSVSYTNLRAHETS